MSRYERMLPKAPIEGHIGFYPIKNAEQWEALPDLYKVMEWEQVVDPFHKGHKLRAVTSVIFNVTFMQPYGIRAEVAVHPADVQKLLFCNYGLDMQCHLYEIVGIELDGGTRLRASWVQDEVTGSFAIKSCGRYVARQGGFDGFVPKSVNVMEDGSYKFDFSHNRSATAHFEFSNPFGEPRKHRQVEKADLTLSRLEKAMNASIDQAKARERKLPAEIELG